MIAATKKPAARGLFCVPRMAAAHILERYMRICFVTDGDLSAYAARAREADLVVCGFQSLGEVSYERELKGETGYFEDVAILSREGKCAVLAGCFTDARGTRRKSVVAADRGRILGVSDMLNRIDGGAYAAGAGAKIYDTAAGKLGVVVAEDVYFPRVTETLSLCGAEIAVCIFEQFSDALEQTLVRAHAFFCGIPVLLCGYGYAFAADAGGKVCFASPQSPAVFELEREQEYHLVETRRRGFFKTRRREF